MQLFICFLKYLLYICLGAEEIFSLIWDEIFLKTTEHILCGEENSIQAQ